MTFPYTLHIALLFLSFSLSAETPFEQAQFKYQEGIKATTYAERNLAFNQALSSFHELEQHDPESIEINQALGNTYFQLGHYPLAILYYQRALKNDHQNQESLELLQRSQSKLGISHSAPIHDGSTPFLKASKRYDWLLWIILSAILLFSIFIWLPNRFVRTLAVFSGLILLIFLGNMVFFYYYTPLEGILIQTTGLYREPDLNQTQVSHELNLAGSKVQILQMTQEGEWLKIKNASGVVGYLPITRVKLI